ncbi:strawberry notch-like NTP hydrolase domain-containing protein [Rugamonas apoptosis]|uniref:Strawberry notch family protein n=1 Tax=Rugamonas apoptosis TaxID=2758570 RepID=A0A7W2INC2_9BURK|nr:strawberry notch family protein [Rugamonas apoptosis]MBA5690544.1 strawberry notch family protein [Rugamonas apoptosis]
MPIPITPQQGPTTAIEDDREPVIQGDLASRSSQLERAAHVYRRVIAALEPGEGLSAAQMRTHFADQIADPARYHEIGEVPNAKGLRIGDRVVRIGREHEVHFITSIITDLAGDQSSVRVHTVSPTSYGGWCELDDVERVEDSPLEPGTADVPVASHVASDDGPARDAEMTIRDASTEGPLSKRVDRTLARRNARASSEAARWGFAPDSLAPGPDGIISAKFDRSERFAELRDGKISVFIDVAQAPNGLWASAVRADDTVDTYATVLAPNGRCRPYSTLDAAVNGALHQLKPHLNEFLHERIKSTAHATLRRRARATLAQRDPALVHKIRSLARHHIQSSVDLFDDGIDLLSGPAYTAHRIELLTLIDGIAPSSGRAATIGALKDAFFDIAAIDDPSPQRRTELLERWLRDAPAPLADSRGEPPQQLQGAMPIAPLKPATAAISTAMPAHAGDEGGPATAGIINVRATLELSAWVANAIKSGRPFSATELFAAADAAFGGTCARGQYTPRDAYDAMEAGVNMAIMAEGLTPHGSVEDALVKLDRLERIMRCLPQQTRRAGETESHDQFSTVPPLAFVGAWAANIARDDLVLEPSAGTGAQAIFGELAGARLIINELSARRLAILRAHWPHWTSYAENGEQLHNILPPEQIPAVVLMNPPFSASAGRLGDTRSASVVELHLLQAVKRLAPNGRLVAIVAESMSPDRPGHGPCWSEIKQSCRLRANLLVDGRFYRKYGTRVDVRLVVLDKTGAHQGAIVAESIREPGDALELLEEIRNERQGQPNRPRLVPSAEPGSGGAASDRVPEPARTAGVGTDALGIGERPGHQSLSGELARRGDTERGDRPDEHMGSTLGDALPDQPGASARPGILPGAAGAVDGTRPGGRGHGPARRPDQRSHDDGRLAGVDIAATAAPLAASALTDAVYEQYVPQRLTVIGSQPHPGTLVQSAAMAAVMPPAPTHRPRLPPEVIESGRLSLPQLEAVVYAGQAHVHHLPSGERQGFFIGDGTGVGKGREISAVILDSVHAGRQKAVWISEKSGLMRDAKRDFAGVLGDPALIFSHAKIKPADAILQPAGIAFTSYSLLARSEAKTTQNKRAPAKARLQQLLNWLGPDFDGVIAFDESHNMANVIEKRGSRGKTPPAAKALAGVELQRALPQARIIYVSATGATEVSNLAYATRLGLWGDGTPFHSAQDFTKSVDAGGVAAMELICRDMKAMGVYIARSLSFDGVTYERLEHELTPLQIDIYNALAGAWQTVLKNVNAALASTGQGKDGNAKSAAMSRFWGAHQRFFNQVVTSMQMATVIEHAREQLAAGNATVFQLVNTNEAAQERQAADMARSGADLEELDFTPRQNLIDYIRNGFPVQQYEEYKDGNGNTRQRPAVDSQGQAVINREMEAKRDALLETLDAIRIPDNPIDMIINTFGPEQVAEVTGRARRFITQHDDSGAFKVMEQKRSAAASAADADAFMADRKRVLVFSDAGGTGYSFHADLAQANQRKRIHYVIQPGWRADKAVQGMGRTHRTNEASQPHYVLPTTNLEAQRRFISSIARRLDQLGALTKGQRQTGAQGLFSAEDNLESIYAARALRIMFNDMYRHRSPLDFDETANAMGLNGLIDQRTGALNESKLPGIPQFLNRLLSLKTHEQDRVFTEFSRMLRHVIEVAKQQGSYDCGVETVRADSVEKLRDELVHADARTGAETRYVELALHRPQTTTPFSELPVFREDGTLQDGVVGFFRNEKTRKVFALVGTGGGTNEQGILITRGRQYHPTGPVRYVDTVDQIVSASRGCATITRIDMVPAYVGEPFLERWERNGRSFQEYSDIGVKALREGGIKGLEYLGTMLGICAERRAALGKVIDRIKAELGEEEVERQVRAYTRLEHDEAEREWARELAAAPRTYVQRIHFITGALLPIWDRIPGSPRVIRTQTDAGERLLGRVVPPSLLQQTLANLSLTSSVANMSLPDVLSQLASGGRATLANGWQLRTTQVGGDRRIELVGRHMSPGDIRWLSEQGALSERIRWEMRIFIPTGANEAPVLQRILNAKPLTDLVPKGGADTDSPAFSRTGGRSASLVATALPVTAVETVASRLRRGWPTCPEIVCVRTVADLPFAAQADTRGAYWRNRVYLVSGNLSDEADVEFTLAHEVLGHFGMRAILAPQQLEAELTRLRENNPSLARRSTQLEAIFGMSPHQATEEALADMAASGATLRGFQRFALAIQRGLRAVGLTQVADWMEGRTQAETLDLLARARRHVLERHGPLQATIHFAPPTSSEPPGEREANDAGDLRQELHRLALGHASGGNASGGTWPLTP